VERAAPTPDPRPQAFEPWEIDAARACVAAFVAARGQFRTQAFEDLVQEALLAWWEQCEDYSAKRGSRRTFLNQVVTSRLKDLRRGELAEKRAADRLAVSLDHGATNDGWERRDALADPQADDPLRSAEAKEVREALNRVRQRLVPRERSVLDGLRQEKTPTDLSRELGVSRLTIYGDLRRIRLALEAEGLRDYLS
jgi:RNA polymerase sigma factor (sigma-70 family)